MKKPFPLIAVLLCSCMLFFSFKSFSQTSWKGITSTAWANATNWTNGVPVATVDAIIGDANFTGAFQPAITAASTAKSLTLGGTINSQLTVGGTFTVKGGININSNGTLINGSASISLTGNWNNGGNYTTNSVNSSVIFNGTAQSLGGTVPTTFRKLTINTGTVVTLSSNLSCTGASALLTVNGTLNPNESPSYLVTTDNLTLNNAAVLKVNAGVFASNYIITTAFLLNAGSIVEYSATAANQVVSSSYTYSTLRISGAGVKSLAADLPALRSTSASTGNIYVLAGTFDLSAYSANRGTTVAGGTISISNGALLKIGGTNSFPAGYNTTTAGITSTVEYNGINQLIAAKTYGNLVLSSSGGAAIKTMPATAFTVAGSLSSNVGAGTSVSYAAASNLTVTGNVNIGASTSFEGGSFSHSVNGNWNNNGTFVPGASTLTLKGAGTVISGNAAQDFYNLTLTASNITASSVTSIGIAGNLTTSGSGAFTQPSPGVLTMTGTAKTITGGNITLNNLAVTGVVTTTTTAILTGDINVSGSLIATAGIITMNGMGKVITNSGTLTFRGLLISGAVTTVSNFTISASLNNTGAFSAPAGTATFIGSSLLSGTVALFNVTINGTSLALAGNAVLGIANAFIITAGSFNVTTYLPNTVNYNGTVAQTIKGTGYNNLILSNGSTKTAGAAITVNNTLTIAPATTFDAVSFTHTIAGNWINNGAFTAGSSTIQFTGATNATISGAANFNNIAINKTLTSYSVTLLNNINVSTINMALGSLYTGSNTITITTTRSGNGIILGTITRVHPFVAATAYAFEGPNNTILFASGVAGVTSVTVNVTVGNVADFPYAGAIGRYYNITVPSGTYNATLRLHYEDAELNGTDESLMQLWKYNGSAWAVSGKTANSTTANYVEKSGLTNLTDRWSFTDDGSVLSWNGSVSTAWANAANWTLVQGTFSGAPTLTDIVQIGIVPFTNQPVITTAVAAKSITLGSAQAVTLTLNGGGALTTYGNITGAWTANTVHTINANNQNITVNGDLVLSDNTTGHTIHLNIGTGTITVTGSLTESGDANIKFTGAGTLNIGKDFLYSGGIFTPATGLVKYTGTVTQLVASVPYNNLTIVKTAGTIATLNTSATLAGNLAVTTGELDISNVFTVNGSVTIGAGAILNGNAATMNVKGNWTSTGTFTPGTGTVNITGSGTQTISAGGFNILSFNKPGSIAVLSGNNAVSGDLSLLAGTLNLSTFTLNQSSPGDIFTIADGTVLLVSGANNFPSNFTTYNLGANSLVHYNGTVAQAVLGDVAYGNINFSNGGALEKTLLGSGTINGNIIINSGASLNSGNFVITLNGNWTNNGGNFTPGTGDVLLNGAGKIITGNTVFNNVTVNGSYSVATSDITFNGLLLVTTAGSYAAGTGVATLNGDLTNSGSLVSTGTTTFSGVALQTIRLLNALVSTSAGVVNFNGNVSPVFNSTTAPTFATLNINNTAGINPGTGWLVLVAFNVSSGAVFNGGASTHTFSGAFTNNGTVTSSGTLNFNATAAVSLQLAGSFFSSTGTVIFGGSGAATIIGAPAAMQDVIIANTNAAGITASSAWAMNGKFSVNSDAIFNAGSFSHSVGGDIESNGTLNGNTSTFTMSSATGQLSGSTETIFHHLTITGAVKSYSDINVEGDFVNNGAWDGSLGALIMTGSNPAVIGGSTNPSTIEQLTVSKMGGAAVTANVNITAVTSLNITSGTLFTATNNLFQNAGGGALTMLVGATLKLGGTNTLPLFNTYALDVQSTVDYAGTDQTLSNSAVYGNLAISAAGNKTAPNFLPLTVAGNFTITAGNFIANNNTHKIAGNWIMTGGSFNNAGSTIRLDGSLDQDIQTIAPFNNFNVSKTSGSVTLSSDITVNTNLSFTNGKIRTGNHTVILPAATVTGAAQSTGWVNGNLQKNISTGSNVSRTFETGGATYYSPVTALFANVSTAGNFIAGAVEADHPQIDFSGINKTLDVNRYWSLTNSGIVFTTATATFNWVFADVDAGAATANFKTGLSNGASWVYPTVFSPLATSIQATGLTSFGTFVVGERSTVTVWTGAAGTADWFTAGNWNGGVPDATVSTLIPTTLQPGKIFPVINTGTAKLNALTIQNAATLTVTGAALQIKGAITGSGTFDAGNGSIELNGSIAQTIPAGVFQNALVKDLTINNNAGASLGGVLGITGVLTLSSGQLSTGGNLVLKSSATATARVAPVTGGSISGNVTVERYTSNRRAWRLLTLPVAYSNSIYSSWQNGGVNDAGKGTYITGPGPNPSVNGLDVSATNTSSMKSFVTATQAFLNITNTKTTTLSGNTKDSSDNIGYFIFTRGDRSPANLFSSGSSATTLSGIGKLQTGTQLFPASTTANKYTLVGNPYASPVDFNLLAKTNLVNRFIVWDPTLNQVGGYVTVDDIATPGTYVASPTSAQTKEIQSGQAFFIQTYANGAASLRINESSKSAVNNVSVFRPVSNSASFRTNLYLLNNDRSTAMADGALVQFKDGFSAAVDFQDAEKFGNVNETIGVLRNGSLLSIERRPPVAGDDTIFLKLTKSTQRDYQFVLIPEGMDNAGVAAFLEDSYTNNSTPLSTTDTSKVNFTIDANAASQANDRFKIIFRVLHVLPVTYTSLKAYHQNSGNVISWKVENQLNTGRYEVERSGDGIIFTALKILAASANSGAAAAYNWLDEQPLNGTNYYRIKSVDAGGGILYSKIVEVKSGKGNGSFSVYPNPVLNNDIGLQLNNLPKGNYKIRLINITGQVLYTKLVMHAGGSSAEAITPDRVLSSGIYKLEMVDSADNKTVINIWVN